MATLDVTEKVNVLVDAIGCDRIAPRYGVELAGSRYAA